MMLRETLPALAGAALALAAVATPATAQTGDGGQQAMMAGGIDRHALGLPVVQGNGALIGWLTGVDMPNRPGTALIERPAAGNAAGEVYAIDAGVLRRSGQALVLGGQVAAQPTEYTLEGVD